MENNSSAILEGLNSEQKRAVECVDGPVLIVAGAGSGKTRVLTSRIAYMLENGCPPERILALTFTKKAASEMKERIAGMVGERKARKLYMGTFHSVFIRFLREYAESIGYPSGFTIYDTSDSVSAIKTCVKELKLDEKVYKPKDVLSRISIAKNNLTTAAAYQCNQMARSNDAAARKPAIADIYSLYDKKCRQAGVMDFDDILLNMNVLLRDNKAALEAISSRFSYIMVDEYQDTNISQYLILKRLSQAHGNMCVVGDDSQSIYAFRGAKIENILNFKKDYPSCKVFRLEQNYRSTKTIVDAANSVIAKNSSRIPKTCFSAGDEGEKIKFIQAYTEQEEALLIASSIIKRIQSSAAQYQDFAVLYRTNSQSRAIEEALRKRNLPYVIYSGHSFYERAEVKDMMAYLKLAVNMNDDEAFKRVVNKPVRGIGDTSVAAIVAAGIDNGCSLMKAATDLNLGLYGLRPAAMSKIKPFCTMIADAAEKSATQDAYSLARSLALDSGLLASYKSDTSIEGQSKAANIEELLDSIKVFVEERHSEFLEQMQADGTISEGETLSESELPVVTLSDYLENVSLLSAVDMEDDQSGSNKISLMTVHSSKGLEFPYVYIAGMEENLFPSGNSIVSINDIEEERRLFYVAMTRAKVAVSMSFATTRMRNGRHESNQPSRFIKEIDSRYVLNPLTPAAAPSITHSATRPAPTYSATRSATRPAATYSATTYSATRPATTTSSSANHSSGITPFRRPAQPVRTQVNDADFEPAPIMQLRAGQRIEHNRFGFGRIIEISAAPELKAKIVFDDHGEKILLLKYAKIRVAESE